jgi:hypothetical protein
MTALLSGNYVIRMFKVMHITDLFSYYSIGRGKRHSAVPETSSTPLRNVRRNRFF